MRLLRLFIFLLFTLSASFVSLQTACAKDYELSSEHFYVTFSDEQTDIAERILAQSEEIYSRLSKILGVEVEEPIYVIIRTRDKQNEIDWAQDEAYFVTIGEDISEEAIKRQIAHGMTITLTLRTSDHSSLHKILLGPLAYNNEFAPDWFLLGIADYYATIDAPGALTESQEFKENLNRLLAEDASRTLGNLAAGKFGRADVEANEIIGLALIQYFAKTYGQERLTQWSHAHASGIVPFTYQKFAKLITDSTWSEIYQDWQTEALKSVGTKKKNQSIKPFVYYSAKVDNTGTEPSDKGAYQEKTVTSSNAGLEIRAGESPLDSAFPRDLSNVKGNCADKSYRNETNENSINNDELIHTVCDNNRSDSDLARLDAYDIGMYRAWKTAWPDEYTPYIGIADDTGFVIGMDLFGEDVLNHHIYQGHVYYMSEKNHVDLELHYTWQQFAWSIDASVALAQKTVSWDTDGKLSYLGYMTHYADLGTEHTWHWFDALSLTLRFAYRFEYNNALRNDDWNDVLDLEEPIWLPQLGWTSSVYMGITLQYTMDPARTMLERAGYYLSASAHIETPFLGGSDYTFIDNFQFTGAWVMPYNDRHAIVADIHAGYSNSQNSSRFPFEILSNSSFELNENVLMHGYAKGSIFGRIYALAHLKYSASILDFQAGLNNFPFGFNRIGMAIFGDGAVILAPEKQSSPTFHTHLDQKYAAGIEVYVDMMFGWHNPIRFTYGLAYGMSEGGDIQHYILLTL